MRERVITIVDTYEVSNPAQLDLRSMSQFIDDSFCELSLSFSERVMQDPATLWHEIGNTNYPFL